MGKKILLADDSITIQKVIELTFSDEDFEVVTVGNGRLAIERVQDVHPDIVLCDIIMPEKDGYEVCDFIKKSPALSSVPVLLLTGAFEPFDQDKATRVGSDGFLAKPFEPQTLIAKVKDLLSQAASRRAAAPPARPTPPPPAPVSRAQVPSPYSPPVPAPVPVAPPTVAAHPAPVAAPPPVMPPQPAPRTHAAPTYPPPVPATTAPWSAPATPSKTQPPAPVAPAWTVSGRAPVAEPEPPEPEPEPEPPQAPEPSWDAKAPSEVSFISDEPYFEPAPIEGSPESEAPPLEVEGGVAQDEDLYIPEGAAAVANDQLMEVVPEEAETLQAISEEPAAAEEPTAPADSEAWAQPTVEVSLEDRAQASVAAQIEGERLIFDEVFAEEPRAAATPPPAWSRPAKGQPDAPAMTARFEPEFGPEPGASTPSPTPAFEPEFGTADQTDVPADLAVPPEIDTPEAATEPGEGLFEPETPRAATFEPAVPEAAEMEQPALAATDYDEPVAAQPLSAYEPQGFAPEAPAEEPATEAVPPEPEASFADVAPPLLEPAPVPVPSVAADLAVPADMVSQIAQRVIAQISDKVIREVAWEVVPDLAEVLIKQEIERLKTELQKIG